MGDLSTATFLSDATSRHAIGPAATVAATGQRPARWLAAACSLLVSLALPVLARAGTAPLSASFDYAMPSRFAIPQIVDPQPPSPEATRYFAGPVRPPSWRVDLDACASTGAILSYAWDVDGQRVGTTAACAGMSFEVPDEGSYQVKLTVMDGAGATASMTHEVRVQDWLLFGLGDSYGSGEGAPDVPVSQDQIDAVATAQSALDAAKSAASQRLAELALAEQDLAALLPLLATAQQRYNQWLAAVAARNDACDNFPPTLAECAAAQAAASAAAAALLAALTDVGLQSFFGTTQILQAITNLRQSAEQAVATARGLLDAANAAVAAATTALNDAIAAVGPRWQNRQCHQSHYSGQVQAAKMLEESDPHTSVTFVHLACSGATINKGLLLEYGGQEPAGNAPHDPQLDAAASLSDGREVDGVIVSIGGNDVRFADLITACVEQTKCFETPPSTDPAAQSYIADMCAPLGPLAFLCAAYLTTVEPPTDSAEAIFLGSGTDCGGRPGDDADAVGLDDLSCNYDALDARVHTLTDEGRLRGVLSEGAPTRLYLTAYPSITRKEPASPGAETQLCAFDPNDPPDERRRSLPGVSAAEMAWAETFVAPMLADGMRTSASTHSWRFVDEHVSHFDGHGYCADDNWIVRIPQSVSSQGVIEPLASSFSGSVHPTAVGQAQYAAAIYDALLCDFYPDCDPAMMPREPQPAVPTTTTTTTMPAEAMCGDASGDGRISASDALQILRAAVGSAACELCRCDVDSNGTVAASDALIVLRRAVGHAVELICSACGG